MRFAFFDLDDTLVDARAALRAWSAEFAVEFVGSDQDAVSGASVASEVFELVEAAANWRAFVARARERYGITASDERLIAQVADTLPGKFVLEDRVRRGLADLREAGWLLGVVTNGSTAVQQAKVDSIGLRPYVDVVVDSEAVGARKPDRRIFAAAADGLGVRLGPDGWMVGDRLDKDVAGGQGVGLRTVWVTRDARDSQGFDDTPSADGPARPTRVAATVLEAFEIVLASAAGPEGHCVPPGPVGS